LTDKKLIAQDDVTDSSITQLQIPKNRITGSTFMYDPPLVRYNDYNKTYEDYEIVSSSTYLEESDLNSLLNGEGFD
jgi:hypothetical protein